jgi:hypothetical protein
VGARLGKEEGKPRRGKAWQRVSGAQLILLEITNQLLGFAAYGLGVVLATLNFVDNCEREIEEMRTGVRKVCTRACRECREAHGTKMWNLQPAVSLVVLSALWPLYFSDGEAPHFTSEGVS